MSGGESGHSLKANGSTAQVPGPNARAGRRRQPALMLVIEADYSSRDLLAQILTTAGYRVAVAPDGNTGLLLAQKLDADVVLLDYHLVDPTGLEVLKGLREQAGAPVTTVLLFKSDDSPSVITEALHHGATNFALRPFEPVELLMRIHQAQFAEAERADLLRRNAQLEQSGSIDWLTGLPNRAYVYRESPAGPAAGTARSQSWSLTSTVSRRSTTTSATPLVTPLCGGWPICSTTRSASRT